MPEHTGQPASPTAAYPLHVRGPALRAATEGPKSAPGECKSEYLLVNLVGKHANMPSKARKLDHEGHKTVLDTPYHFLTKFASIQVAI